MNQSVYRGQNMDPMTGAILLDLFPLLLADRGRELDLPKLPFVHRPRLRVPLAPSLHFALQRHDRLRLHFLDRLRLNFIDPRLHVPMAQPHVMPILLHEKKALDVEEVLKRLCAASGWAIHAELAEEDERRPKDSDHSDGGFGTKVYRDLGDGFEGIGVGGQVLLHLCALVLVELVVSSGIVGEKSQRVVPCAEHQLTPRGLACPTKGLLDLPSARAPRANSVE